MRRADRNEDACFTDVQAPEAVHHGDAVDGKSLVELHANLAHFGQRHGLVSFIFKVFRGAPVRFLAHETIERDDGAVLPRAHVPDQRRRINGRLDKLEVIVFERGGHCGEAQPPLTGGRKAISSPLAIRVSHGANS